MILRKNSHKIRNKITNRSKMETLLCADKARKPLMVVPFLGHIISGVLMILNVYFENWDPRLLWLSEIYILFGGYSLLSIAM